MFACPPPPPKKTSMGPTGPMRYISRGAGIPLSVRSFRVAWWWFGITLHFPMIRCAVQGRDV